MRNIIINIGIFMRKKIVTLKVHNRHSKQQISDNNHSTNDDDRIDPNVSQPQDKIQILTRRIFANSI